MVQLKGMMKEDRKNQQTDELLKHEDIVRLRLNDYYN